MKRRTQPPRLTPPDTRKFVGGLYSATLFFEFCVFVSGKPGDRRTCEKRIVLLEASSARAALRLAQAQGRGAQFRYKNTDRNPVHFRFIGVTDLCHLGMECEPNEVWYAIGDRLRPMERKAIFVPNQRSYRQSVVRRGGPPNERAVEQRDAPDKARRCARFAGSR